MISHDLQMIHIVYTLQMPCNPEIQVVYPEQFLCNTQTYLQLLPIIHVHALACLLMYH